MIALATLKMKFPGGKETIQDRQGWLGTGKKHHRPGSEEKDYPYLGHAADQIPARDRGRAQQSCPG